MGESAEAVSASAKAEWNPPTQGAAGSGTPFPSSAWGAAASCTFADSLKHSFGPRTAFSSPFSVDWFCATQGPCALPQRFGYQHAVNTIFQNLRGNRLQVLKKLIKVHSGQFRFSFHVSIIFPSGTGPVESRIHKARVKPVLPVPQRPSLPTSNPPFLEWEAENIIFPGAVDPLPSNNREDGGLSLSPTPSVFSPPEVLRSKEEIQLPNRASIIIHICKTLVRS